MNEVSFISTETSNFGPWLFFFFFFVFLLFFFVFLFKWRKYRKLQSRINERKTLFFFIVKPPLSITQNQSSLSGYCQTWNSHVTYVISEAAYLAVVKKKRFYCHFGWSAILIASLWLFLPFSGRRLFYLIILLSKRRRRKKKKNKKQKKKKKRKLGSTSRIQGRGLSRSLIIFCFIWIWSRNFNTLIFYQIFFIRSFIKHCTKKKNMVSNVGRHIFFSCLLHFVITPSWTQSRDFGRTQ